MINIIVASRLRRSSFISSLFIGGVDAAKYADAQGFSDNFRAQHNPANPVVIPVQNILNYSTQPDGNGRLNINVEIAWNFAIPNQVFDNNISDSGSRITYFVDSQGLATKLGSKLFDKNPDFKYLITNNITDISGFWLSFTIADVPRVLNFEDAINIEDSAFINYRNPNDRINIRNVTNITADPATDAVFENYNLSNRTEPKKVIYVHPSLETINNGSPLNSLQSAITRGADVRYVTNKNLPSNFQIGDVIFSEIGSNYIDFTISTPASSNGIDYYDVFILDTSNPNDVIRRYFPIQEITDADTLLIGLEPNKNYKVKIQAVDVLFNKNERFDLGTITTLNNDITITEVSTGGTYSEFSITNTTSLTITEVEIYVDGVLNTISNKYAVNLNELTSYNIDVIAKTSEGVNLISNTINVTTTTTPALFQNAVAYYKLDEISDDAIDVVNGYNGTLFGGVTQGVAGKIGRAYSFDGTSGYIELSDNDDFSFTDGINDIAFTIRCWVNLNSTATQMLWGKAELGSAEYYFRIASGKISVQLFSEADSSIFLRKNTVGNVITNQWTHIIATYDGSNIKIYQNGVEESTTDASVGTYAGMSNNNTSVQISRNKFVNSQFIDGFIDEIAIIKGEAWTAGQISEDYNNGIGITN